MKYIMMTMFIYIVILASSSHLMADINEGLIGYWSFDQCDATDDSHHGLNGILNGGPTCVDGKKGKAFYFDGRDDQVIVKNLNFSYDQLTISAWVFLKSIIEGSPEIIGVINDNGSIGFQLEIGGDSHGKQSIMFDAPYEYTTRLRTDNYILEMGDWHLITGVYDGSSIKIYYDARLVANSNASGSFEVQNGTIHIGAEVNQLTSFWYGYLDEIRVYNRALSEIEIEELYNHKNECDDESDQYDDGYNDGFQAGKEYCMNNPSACGIDIEDSGECPPCECDLSDDTCKASFNMFTNTLHVPCLDMGKSYWLDLELINSGPVQLELKGFGEN